MHEQHPCITRAFSTFVSCGFGTGNFVHLHILLHCLPAAYLQFCTRNFLSESALEAIQAGRGNFAATLVDMGLLPASFQNRLQAVSHQHETETEPHEFDAYSNNGRVVKAALCAGTSRSCAFSKCVAAINIQARH